MESLFDWLDSEPRQTHTQDASPTVVREAEGGEFAAIVTDWDKYINTV